MCADITRIMVIIESQSLTKATKMCQVTEVEHGLLRDPLIQLLFQVVLLLSLLAQRGQGLLQLLLHNSLEAAQLIELHVKIFQISL